MKISIIALGLAVTLGACGGDDHDGVVWDATATAPGTRVGIQGDRLVLEKDGQGGESCEDGLPLCDAAQVALELPAGDFEVRFTGVGLMSDNGAVGAVVETADGWALTHYSRHGDSEGVVVQVLAPDKSTGFDSGNGFGERHDAELLLVRQNDQIGVRGMTAENEATETAVLGTGPATLTVFAVAFEDSLEDSTRGELTGRALSGDVTSFDGDVIAE